MRDITELPHDIFLLIIVHLSPRTCVRCRCVSRQWHDAFTSEVASLLLLRWNFPRCREMRLAAAASSSRPLSEIPANLRAELGDIAEEPRPWSSILAEVARRYYYLNRAKPRLVEKLDMAQSSRHEGSAFSFWGVAPWSRFLRFNDKTSDFHYPDPVWSYSQEDGILVYPAAAHDAPSAEDDGRVYHIVDLATGQRIPVPFDVRSKHVRRVRLAQGVLIVEWAEALPYHQLNDREVVHRHFVTAFDVTRKPSATWDIEFRSEWKLHFLGLPLNRSDRFFSAHTATHYAAYFWQPNRSLYHVEPIEQLAVWDISRPSPYRPSEDAKGGTRPAVTRAPSLPPGLWNGSNGTTAVRPYGLNDANSAGLQRPKAGPPTTAPAGPRVIRRLAWRDLDFYGLRQRATPQFRNLALDEQNLYVVEEEHRWADGQHSSLIPPRVHLVRCTGIPIVPMPASPELPPEPSHPAAARSTGNLGIIQAAETNPLTRSAASDGPVHGPVWVDICGADGDVHMSFCRRVANADAHAAAHHRIENIPLLMTTNSGPETRERLEEQSRLPSVTARGWPWALAENEEQNALLGSGLARWPGLAPCWRHEDFPYLTVTEMVDFAAGVRVTARHCFMLETMSVHVRPAVAVEGTAPSSEQDNGAEASKARVRRRRRSSAGAESARSKEVHFPDDIWSELMAKGHIAGDERWIVGEDDEGRITVVRF